MSLSLFNYQLMIAPQASSSRDPTADECHDESYNARLLAVAAQALLTPAYILTSISYSLII